MVPRSGPTTEPPATRNFLFVDTQDDVSQEYGVGREKMAFLSKLAYQRKKKDAIARLRWVRQTKNQQTAVAQGAFRVQVAPTAIPFDGAREGSVWAQMSAALPAIRYIGLFLAAENKAFLESTRGGSVSTNAKSSREAIPYRIEAIKHLNRLLQEPLTAGAESIILCVSTMKHCEALTAQFAALQAHENGLRSLIHLAGGLERLGHALLATIYQGDIATAALNDSGPCFPMFPRFRREVLDEPAMFSRSNRNYEYYGRPIPPPVSSFGTRFTKSPWYLKLDADLKNTFHAWRRLFIHFEMGTRIPSLVKPTDKDLYIILLHHLLSLRYPACDNDLNEPLRRTLFIYTYLRIWNFGGFPVTRVMMKGLKESLIPRLACFQATAPDLLLWILFIGAISSQGHESYPWFVGTLRDTAIHLNLPEWDAARAMLVQFFYSDRPGYITGADLWNELMAPSQLYIAPGCQIYF
ncbi:hypothetical protein BJX99DRAFT_253438 [Aspergillus californicus]